MGVRGPGVSVFGSPTVSHIKCHFRHVAISPVEDGALTLLNCPSVPGLFLAIQKQPTLDEKKAQVKFEVASKSAKYGRVECTVHASHVSCRCPSFKSDKVCKHAVAVAEKSGILRQHLGYICKDLLRSKRSIKNSTCRSKSRKKKQYPVFHWLVGCYNQEWKRTVY